MENVCKRKGEQFMWKAVMTDNKVVTEFEDNDITNDIIKEVMDNPELEKFGLCGNGYYSYFDAKTGIFTLFNGTDTIEIKLIIDDKNIIESQGLKNKIIHFRTAENMFEPQLGRGVDKVFRYSFGYKFEDEHVFVRMIMAFDMYKSILLQPSITGKTDDKVCVFEIYINGKRAAQPHHIKLEKNRTQNIEIPLSMNNKK